MVSTKPGRSGTSDSSLNVTDRGFFTVGTTNRSPRGQVRNKEAAMLVKRHTLLLPVCTLIGRHRSALCNGLANRGLGAGRPSLSDRWLQAPFVKSRPYGRLDKLGLALAI